MSHAPHPNRTITPFARLLVDLTVNGVDFAVVGGVAVFLNGYERATFDLDILVNAGEENVQKLLKVLGEWGDGHARELTVDDFPLQEGSIRIMEEFDLDIFTQMRGNVLDTFRPRLKQVDLDGVAVNCLSPEDLILLKKDSWRDKDKLDALAMQELLARKKNA